MPAIETTVRPSSRIDWGMCASAYWGGRKCQAPATHGLSMTIYEWDDDMEANRPRLVVVPVCERHGWRPIDDERLEQAMDAIPEDVWMVHRSSS